MTEIIPPHTAEYNTGSSLSTNFSEIAKLTNSPSNDGYNPLPLDRPLTDLEDRLLRFYYREWCDIGRSSDRTLIELALILRRSPTKISEAASHLKKVGLLLRERAKGRFFGKKHNTCISTDGCSYLANKPRSQMERQIINTPYIDPLKAKGEDLFYLEEQETCEQIIFDYAKDTEPKVDALLMHQKVPYGQRDLIKQDLIDSKIGPVRIEKVITRVVAAAKKKPIRHFLEYIKRCIETERKEMVALFHLLRGKNLPYFEYAK